MILDFEYLTEEEVIEKHPVIENFCGYYAAQYSKLGFISNDTHCIFYPSPLFFGSFIVPNLDFTGIAESDSEKIMANTAKSSCEGEGTIVLVSR